MCACIRTSLVTAIRGNYVPLPLHIQFITAHSHGARLCTQTYSSPLGPGVCVLITCLPGASPGAATYTRLGSTGLGFINLDQVRRDMQEAATIAHRTRNDYCLTAVRRGYLFNRGFP